MAKITTTNAHTSGIVLGGIGYAFCALALSVTQERLQILKSVLSTAIR